MISSCKAFNSLNKLSKRLEWFFYSLSFPVFIGLITSLLYFSGQGVVAALFFCILGGIIFALFEDMSPLIPCLFMFVMSFSNLSFLDNIKTYLVTIPLIIGIAIHFIRFKFDRKRGKLFFPLLVFFISLGLGGITVKTTEHQRIMAWVSYTFGIGAFLFATYTVFFGGIKIKRNFRLDKYVATSVICASFVTFTMLGYNFISSLLTNGVMINSYGWGLSIQIGTLTLLSLPCCFYMMVKTEKVISFGVLACTIILFCIITRSEGSIAVTLSFLAVLIIITRNKLPIFLRKRYYAFWLSILAVFVILALVFKDYTAVTISRILKAFSNDTGRTRLFEQALEDFFSSPIFGAGYYYLKGTATPLPWNYHSTIFHSLGTAGIVGFIAVMFYLVARIIVLMEKHTDLNLYFLICFFAFQCYAFVDTAEYNPVPLSATLLIMLLVVEKYNKEDYSLIEDKRLPLFYKRKAL